ncbi:MAG: hypothetical protein K8S18_00565 [Desulfobacula sp.]|nr:hypothetical protein [Desulfobacula sp.]
MQILRAINNFMDSQKMNSGEKNVKNYSFFFKRFEARFGHKKIDSVTSDQILNSLTQDTEEQKQTTKRYKFTILNSFFNFIQNTISPKFINPCDTPILKNPKGKQWTILEKDIVVEMIFKTDNPRSRLMLELMARGGKVKPIPALTTTHMVFYNLLKT